MRKYHFNRRNSMRNRNMRPGYISGGAVSVLLIISVTAVIYTTVKVKNWWEKL